jgi:glycerol transport system ATP-binding protein
MNAAPVVKTANLIRLSDQLSWPADGQSAKLADGPYTIGLRPHFVSPRGGPGVPLTGRIAIAELTGSESVAHFAFAGVTWVSQSDGVHPYRVGDSHEFRLDVSRGLYFDKDGRRVA